MTLGSTQHLTEISTSSISWGQRRPVRKADNLPPPVLLSRNLGSLTSWNPLGTSGPCSGTALPLPLPLTFTYKYEQYTVKHNSINDFIKVYFLHCFVQRHVSALVMSHLQVGYFSQYLPQTFVISPLKTTASIKNPQRQ